MKKDIIVFNYKKQIETEEFFNSDLLEIFGFDWEHDDVDFLTKKDSDDLSWVSEVGEIKITELKSKLEELEKLGCNFVEIFYHGDHSSYVLNGLNVYKSDTETEKETIYKQKQEQIEKVKARKDVLEAQLNEVNDIIKELENK